MSLTDLLARLDAAIQASVMNEIRALRLAIEQARRKAQ
jgi:hypothetical protein